MACLVVARWIEEPAVNCQLIDACIGHDHIIFHMFDAADVIHAIGSSVLGMGVEVRSNLLYPSSALQSSEYNAR